MTAAERFLERPVMAEGGNRRQINAGTHPACEPRSRKGRSKQAPGGTLFLDEIGEVSATFQSKMPSILLEGEFERGGGGKTIKFDISIIWHPTDISKSLSR